MAEWKTQIGYNYNPSYHAYAYGLVYQPGPEQNHGNMTGWGEATVTDLSNYNPGVTQVYYAATARTLEESPPRSPEQHVMNGHCHYQGSGLVYLGDGQAGRLLLAGPHRVDYDTRANDTRRAGSDSTSDSEAHASPDSWSFGSREGMVSQADPDTWPKKDLDEEASSSPDTIEDVSSSLMGEPLPFVDVGTKSTTNNISVPSPVPTPKKQSTTAATENPKAKVRAAFSETQMNTLVQRFSVQRYLTPAEMKNLAELTGLTYKQVKTWFQNRRMKLRRHQKDTNWVSERFTANKDSPVRGGIFPNIHNHIPPYQDSRAQRKEQYNHHMMEAALKKTAPQNLAFYLAAMGSAAGSAGYPSWPPSSPQAALPTRPQAASWSVPQGTNHYEFNTSAFNSAPTTEPDAVFDCKDGEATNGHGSINPAMVPHCSQ
ncbi:homeobox protein NANOG [Aulostomus maculatus]